MPEELVTAQKISLGPIISTFHEHFCGHYTVELSLKILTKLSIPGRIKFDGRLLNPRTQSSSSPLKPEPIIYLSYRLWMLHSLFIRMWVLWRVAAALFSLLSWLESATICTNCTFDTAESQWNCSVNFHKFSPVTTIVHPYQSDPKLNRPLSKPQVKSILSLLRQSSMTFNHRWKYIMFCFGCLYAHEPLE